MSKASIDDLDVLHKLVASELSRKIRSGEATAAEFTAAINFLKHNGIEARATDTNPLGNLSKAITDSLPFAGEDGPSH